MDLWGLFLTAVVVVAIVIPSRLDAMIELLDWFRNKKRP